MAKFRITGTVTISVHTIVDAESKSEAIDIASDRFPQTLPANLGGNPDEDFVITNGELDGEVEFSDDNVKNIDCSEDVEEETE